MHKPSPASKPPLPRSLIIWIDTREKKPLLFPETLKVTYLDGSCHTHALATRKKELVAGDYALQGYEDVCLVERKSGIHELWQNTSNDDKSRFVAAWNRMVANCKYPYLVVEQTVSDLLAPHQYVRDPGNVVDQILALTIDPTIPILSVRSGSPIQKRQSGELVARLLVQAALKEIQHGRSN